MIIKLDNDNLVEIYKIFTVLVIIIYTSMRLYFMHDIVHEKADVDYWLSVGLSLYGVVGPAIPYICGLFFVSKTSLKTGAMIGTVLALFVEAYFTYIVAISTSSTAAIDLLFPPIINLYLIVGCAISYGLFEKIISSIQKRSRTDVS